MRVLVQAAIISVFVTLGLSFSTAALEHPKSDDRYGESTVGLPPVPADRRDAYDFYKLGFLSDGYPGKRADGRLVAHPIYGSYLLYDYMKLFSDTKDPKYLAASKKIADATIGRMEHLKEYDALAFYFEPAYDLAYFPGRFYSGLVQARYLMPLTSLAKASGEKKYAEAARKIANSLRVPKSKGGVLVSSHFGDAVEEYPHDVPSYVLNGWTTIILELLKYAERASDPVARELALTNIETLKNVLPLYDVPTNLSSRYQLSGFGYVKFHFSKKNVCKFDSYQTKIDDQVFYLRESKNRWDNYIFSSDIDENGFNIERRVRLNNVFTQADPVQHIQTNLECREDSWVKYYVGYGDYDPNLSGMPTKRWIYIGKSNLVSGKNELNIDVRRDRIPMIGYPTNFKKKFAGKTYNVYHWLHIMNLRRINELVPTDLFAYYADLWEEYTKEWKRLDFVKTNGFNANCPPVARSCDNYGELN
jgi:hypothetical protein